MKTFTVKSRTREELIDITRPVLDEITASGIMEGICVVFTPHTTAGITINENADPTVPGDIIRGIDGLGIDGLSYRHGEGNSPAHIKSTLTGCSETLIIQGGRPLLGTWQGIFFCEFDGPRTRKVHVKLVSG